ncbi:MAG: SAM-dependent DNA methyltransferase [Planctomycetes bacterium]|nr:SAM-dependent DNA methyltransferase [Planctomycetota bacterium]
MRGPVQKALDDKSDFIWKVADLIRGPYKPNQFKDVMLPLTVLRRLDCVLEPTRQAVHEANKKWAEKGEGVLRAKLEGAAGVPFYNTSQYSFEKLKGDPTHLAANLTNYINGFSDRARDILKHFRFEEQIEKLDKHNRLFLVIQKFCEIDLHPDKVLNTEMGYIFENLIQRFNEASNETAGDHFTPREVVRLAVNLIFTPDEDVLVKKEILKTLFDPACGTGGMLSVSEDYMKELNPDAKLKVYGQDYNDESYAVCGSDMMIKGHSVDNIAFGDSFTADQFKGKKFDYMLANPPFGVEWKPQAEFIKAEAERGQLGRFAAGLPRINDGSLLFLMHMISKMKPVNEGGTRLAIVFNGSPLFTGSAGSGESNIRKWIIENDWLEAVVALPDQLFYNTGIYTYLWVITNRKEDRRKGKIQLINATAFSSKMRKSLGNKRNEISEKHRNEITRLYGEFKEGEYVKIFDNDDFGYQRITVERPLKLNFAVTEDRLNQVESASAFQNLATSKKRKDKVAAAKEVEAGKQQQQQILSALKPLAKQGVVKSRDEFSKLLRKTMNDAGVKLAPTVLKAVLYGLSERDESAEICTDRDGKPEPDAELRDYENVPLKDNIQEYMAREVLPHVPDAWIDEAKTKTGYEINFNRYFYKYVPPRDLDKIEADLLSIEAVIAEMLKGRGKA